MDFWTQVKSIEEEMLGNSAVRWISGFNFHGHLRSSPPSYSPCSPCPPRGPALPHQRGCGPPRLILVVRLCSAPVSAPCPSADTLLALPLPRCRRRLLTARPPCAAGEDEGTEKTTSIFGAILSPRVRVARSARRRLKTTAPCNTKPAVESVWEHERSPSSHDSAA